MSDEESPMKSALGTGFFALICLGFGIWAIIDPTAMDGADASGRRAFFKAIIIYVWGRPFGIIAVLIGLGCIYAAYRTLADRNTTH